MATQLAAGAERAAAPAAEARVGSVAADATRRARVLLRGRLDRVFQYRARTPTATTAHKELESSVSTTQDLIRRFVCRDQPAVRLPEDTTEAPPSPESVAPHSSDPSIVPPAVSTGEITVEEPAEDRLPEDEQTLHRVNELINRTYLLQECVFLEGE